MQRLVSLSTLVLKVFVFDRRLVALTLLSISVVWAVTDATFVRSSGVAPSAVLNLSTQQTLCSIICTVKCTCTMYVTVTHALAFARTVANHMKRDVEKFRPSARSNDDVIIPLAWVVGTFGNLVHFVTLH